ncbi:MAG: hypothetical protein J2P17_36480, partial [Mycobacterium sp.]|nr:hypothetical protein [Mycobacterium sp.]
CANYALHTAAYKDEVRVLVGVTNSSPKPTRYAIDVDLSVQRTGPATVTTTEVTISGLVAAKTSTQLGRKVLTTGPVSRCWVVHTSRS